MKSYCAELTEEPSNICTPQLHTPADQDELSCENVRQRASMKGSLRRRTKSDRLDRGNEGDD